MGTNKKKARGRKRRAGKASKRTPQGSREMKGPKLSDLVKKMALQLLRAPHKPHSDATSMAVLMLASDAWNRAIGASDGDPRLQESLDQIDWDGARPWAELHLGGVDDYTRRLIAYKNTHFPNDERCITTIEITVEGHLRVQWTDPNEDLAPPSESRNAKPQSKAQTHIYHPIAGKLIETMAAMGVPLVDLKAKRAGNANAETLQETIATQADLAEEHPAYIVYSYAQTQVSIVIERLGALKETAPLLQNIVYAAAKYKPSGPPMSPLTFSFFTGWSLFDACIGRSEETLGTLVLAMGKTFKMHEDLVRVIGLMQRSRMGIYAHEGIEGDTVILRELVTDRVHRAIVPSGYLGHKGELWYVRVLPPPLPGIVVHTVFTKPYILEDSRHAWRSYFSRNLPDAPESERIKAYERLLKFGPTRDYWTEFVFEAYLRHIPDAVFLRGMPDLAHTRPHSPQYRG